MKLGIKQPRFWISTAIILETISATYLLNLPQFSIPTTIAYFISGIAIAFLLLSLPTISFRSQETVKPFMYLVLVGIFVTSAIFCFYNTRYWIGTTPLSYKYADMLPVIKVMSERFVNGQISQVYKPIPEIWGGMQPIYYPAMWLPYTFGVLMNIDLRWINSFFLFGSFTVCLLVSRLAKDFFSTIIFFVPFLLLIIWLYTEQVHNYIRLTEEGVVVGYYTFFILAIVSRRPILIGISLALCLLSRYSIIGWIPAITVYLIWQKNFRQLFFIGGACLVTVLLLILPFGLSTFGQLIQHSTKYMYTIPDVWQQHPEYFTNFLGFARFFVPEHFKLLHYTLLTFSFLLPVLFIVFCIRLQKKFQVNNVMLATAKLSLVVFYCFIDVPYLYLFYTSSIVSLLIAALLTKKETTLK